MAVTEKLEALIHRDISKGIRCPPPSAKHGVPLLLSVRVNASCYYWKIIIINYILNSTEHS